MLIPVLHTPPGHTMLAAPSRGRRTPHWFFANSSHESMQHVRVSQSGLFVSGSHTAPGLLTKGLWQRLGFTCMQGLIVDGQLGSGLQHRSVCLYVCECGWVGVCAFRVRRGGGGGGGWE